MLKQSQRFLLTAAVLLLTAMNTSAQRPTGRNSIRITDPAFFQTDEARQIGEQVLLYQRVTGGWPKNIDMARPLSDEERAKVQADKQRRNDSTTDNNATSMQMNYLARLYQATKEKRYREGFRKGVDYLLSGQYANGGWPQFWPEMRDYQIHITYNDNAMINTMKLLRDIAKQKEPYGGDLTTKAQRQRMQEAFDKGIECILNTQIVANGELTIWCQQHYRDTYLPAPARAYELPSYCPMESVGIVDLLMSLPEPSERVKKAVHQAMKWFDKYKLTGLTIKRDRDNIINGKANTLMIDDPKAAPIWARFYDLENCEPYVCDRDGVPRHYLEEIGPERRNGYSWFGNYATRLYSRYEKWANKYDAANKVAISLETKGANENGTLKIFHRPAYDIKPVSKY